MREKHLKKTIDRPILSSHTRFKDYNIEYIYKYIYICHKFYFCLYTNYQFFFICMLPLNHQTKNPKKKHNFSIYPYAQRLVNKIKKKKT